MFVRIIGIVIIFTSIAVISGWVLDIPMLTNISPLWMSMKMNTAISFLLCGISFLLLSRNNLGLITKEFIVITSIILILIGCITILEFVLGLNLYVDEFFLKEKLNSSFIYPGRMTFMSAANFVMIAFVFLYQFMKNASGWVIQTVAWLIFILSLLSFYNYLNQVPWDYSYTRYTTMALHSTFLFMLIQPKQII